MVTLNLEGNRNKVGQNTIVINGKHYDAKTGALLKASEKPSVVHTMKGTALDGFSRRPSVAKSVAPAHKIHQKTEKSKTLMRGAVKKPMQAKVHATAAPLNTAASHTKSITEKPHKIDRLERANQVPKSSLVSKFGTAPTVSNPSEHTQKQPVAHVPVKEAPAVSRQAAPLPPALKRHNPFDDALERATSHQRAMPKKPSRRQKLATKLRVSPRMVSAGSFVLAGLLLSGFFVYQNIPNLAMRVAATRSGVEAKLPGYKPAGFAINGPIKYSAGKISVQYKSTTDERNFAVNQSATEWNDETLLDNFVAVERRSYQTYQDKGKTIYIYDDNNATWIDNGVWYQIEGASSLNSDQLLRIANSL